MGKRNDLVIVLNSYNEDDKNNFWLNNQFECRYKSSVKDGSLEYNWYYFEEKEIWMCRLYDYDRLKEGKGVLSETVFFTEKEDLLTKNKQWEEL